MIVGKYRVLVFSALMCAATQVVAQGTQVAFGTVQENSGLPVEVTSENLEVDRNTGVAIFTGDVIAIQGEMRLSADRVDVFYNEAASAIERVEAEGNVVLISGADAAEAERAVYTLADSLIVMTDNVLVSQGPSLVSGDRMDIQVNDGTAQVIGRVKTILQTSDQ